MKSNKVPKLADKNSGEVNRKQNKHFLHANDFIIACMLSCSCCLLLAVLSNISNI